MYEKENFKTKKIKRDIEDTLTTLKYKDGNALSLTGPFIEGHVENYKTINIQHVYIAENDYNTYLSMVDDPYLTANNNYVSLKYGDVFDYFHNLNPIVFSEVDLDFTKTIGTLLPILKSNLPKMLTQGRFTNNFTLIFTFCHRQSRHTKENLLELDMLINSFSWFNINDIYYKSYRDGTPMFTQMFRLSKCTNKVYNDLKKLDIL
jgi:hypothetical protein